MRGIRFRATALVTAVTALALLAGGFIVTSVLRDRLTENLDATVSEASAGRADLLAAGADPAGLTDSSLQESLVWIGTPAGEPIAQGGKYHAVGAPTGATPGVRTETVLFEEGSGAGAEREEETLRLSVSTATSPTLGELIVVVGAELEVVDDPVTDVARVLLLGSPVLLLVVGGLTWITADRALRPVGSIRADAERISTHAPGRAIDVPSTGDEIEALAATVNEMLERLAASGARQREFVGDASHELKSPLANLRIDIETSGLDAATASRHLGQIDRLTAIVDDLLALARSDEGRTEVRAAVDLDDAVFDALEAAASGHDVRIDIDRVEPTRVHGHENQLRRLVRNLVDNATRHAETAVAIQLSIVDDHAVLHVDDDGPGVPPENRDQIFDRFVRLDAARDRDVGGTGLGLAIVQTTATQHGGSVTVTDSPLGGARFTVQLPVQD